MNVEEAIKLSLDYEGKVHNLYLEAVKTATDDAGKRVFQVLADEEMSHLKYLNSCLDEWQKSGKITAEKLATVFPSRERIEEGLEKLKQKIEPQGKQYDVELDNLRKALDVEVETSEFYKSVVKEIDPEGRQLFERFVEIEEGHKAIVQAEIDSVSGLGFWFDHMEFSMEGG